MSLSTVLDTQESPDEKPPTLAQSKLPKLPAADPDEPGEHVPGYGDYLSDPDDE